MPVYAFLSPTTNKPCSTNSTARVLLVKCTIVDPWSFPESLLLSQLILAMLQLFSSPMVLFADSEIRLVIESRTEVTFALFTLIGYVTAF